MSNSEFLYSLIHAKFNTTHFHDEFTEKAYFCGDCGGNSLTQHEKETEHVGHNVIRAMKNTHRYCYKKADILSLKTKIDVSGVCCYSINSFDVYFPKSRIVFRSGGQWNGSIAKQGYCRTCGWSFPTNQKGSLYCSILCKLECSGDAESMNDKLIMEQQEVGACLINNKTKSSSKKRKRGVSGGFKKIGGKSKKVVCLKIKCGGNTVILGNNNGKKTVDDLGGIVGEGLKNMSYRKKSRKGIPRRAPFC